MKIRRFTLSLAFALGILLAMATWICGAYLIMQYHHEVYVGIYCIACLLFFAIYGGIKLSKIWADWVAGMSEYYYHLELPRDCIDPVVYSGEFVKNEPELLLYYHDPTEWYSYIQENWLVHDNHRFICNLTDIWAD